MPSPCTDAGAALSSLGEAASPAGDCEQSLRFNYGQVQQNSAPQLVRAPSVVATAVPHSTSQKSIGNYYEEMTLACDLGGRVCRGNGPASGRPAAAAERMWRPNGQGCCKTHLPISLEALQNVKNDFRIDSAYVFKAFFLFPHSFRILFSRVWTFTTTVICAWDNSVCA